MKRLIFALLFALPLMGQVPVTVTGLITDAGNNPATSGFVQFDIQPKISSVHYFIPTVGTITQTVQCGIDGTGNVKSILNLANPCLVWGNDVISPGNTTYKVTIAPSGNITNVIIGECITGAAYSLSFPVFCPIVQLTPQQGVIRSNPFQVNILPNANNVFNIGSPQAQYAAIYASNLFLNGSLFNSATVAFINQPNVFTQTNTFPAIKSSSANTASTGFVRMASTDGIAWRNNANSADITLNKSGALSGNYPTDTIQTTGGFGATFFSAFSNNTAAGGLLRLQSGDTINWRNNANTLDLLLSKRSAAAGNVPVDTLVWDSTNANAFEAGAFIQNGSDASVAVAGAVRLHSGDSINWRNNANSADLALSKDSSDRLSAQPFAGLIATNLVIPGNHAVTGQVQLNSSDTIAWRNNANNADVVLSKNASNNLVFPNGLSLGGDAAFTASPRGTLTVFFPGPLTTTWTQLTWITTAPIRSLQIRTQAKTAPAGCGTNAVIRIGDGGTNVDTVFFHALV